MIFVSYSRVDIVPVRGIVEALRVAGIECWIDEFNIPVGQAFVKQLGDALRNADCYMLVDTAASRSSYWVSRELQTSSRYRRDGKYHSLMRIYSPECQYTDRPDWDLSMVVDQRAADLIVAFLTSRRSDGFAHSLDDRGGAVSFINSNGLGQPSSWVGRREELRCMDEWWFGSSPGIWLQGVGGAGKSGLIQTWVTALSYLGYCERVRATALYVIGRQLRATEEQRCLVDLMSRSACSQRLFILDGHDEAESIDEVEHLLVEVLSRGVRAVVSSRKIAPPQLAKQFIGVSLTKMTRHDSIALLNQHGHVGLGTAELADAAGDHPLALLLLSRHLADGNTSATQVLADLRAGDVSSHPVQTALSTSIQRLTPNAKSLLETLCRSHGRTTERGTLADPAIRELTMAGLIQIDDFDTPRRLSIHPMVRNFVLEEI